MQISSFKNFAVNIDAKFYTTDAHIELPDGLCIGRVDHFKKTTIESIVKAYIRQVVIRENQKGKHTLEIQCSNKLFGPAVKTVKVFINV